MKPRLMERLPWQEISAGQGLPWQEISAGQRLPWQEISAGQGLPWQEISAGQGSVHKSLAEFTPPSKQEVSFLEHRGRGSIRSYDLSRLEEAR